MFAQTVPAVPTPSSLAEYGPVWALVGILLVVLGYIGQRLIERLMEQNERVTNAQVAALQSLTATGNATAAACVASNQKLDAHTRLFESGLLALKTWASETGDRKLMQHVDVIETQLRNDVSRGH